MAETGADGPGEPPSLGYAAPGLINAPEPVDPVAAKAMRCSMLFFLTPIPCGLAVYYGVRGFRRARRRAVPGEFQGAAAVFLGVVGLIAWVVVPYGVVQVRRATAQIHCQSNLRDLGSALNMYAQQNGGIYPQRLQDILSLKVPPGELVCPSSGIPDPPPGATAVPTSYVFLAAGMPANGFKSADVIVFEVSAHPSGKVAVLYGDGHGMLLRPDQVAAEAQKTLDKVASMRAATRSATTRPGV